MRILWRVRAELLVYADTVRSATMRHEVPLAIIDPFAFAQSDGRTIVMISSLEADRVQAALPHAEVIDPVELGRDELLAEGRNLLDVEIELVARLCEHLGLETATVPGEFPLDVADRLRASGVELSVDTEGVLQRRRVKNAAELEGVRRASAAAVAGMEAARDALRAGVGTAEEVREALREACRLRGCPAGPDVIVGPGAQGASGHEPGSGPIDDGVSVIVDLWPQDELTRCSADMTRTFVRGEIPEDLVRWHGLCLDALERVLAAVRPGVTGKELFDISCEVFEAAGEPTQRTKEPGVPLRDGYFHSLGHGVGLEVHEEPWLGRAGHDPLVAGDVIAVEPGCYRHGYGGVRLEDLVLVTGDGAEVLTPFPYDLAL